MDARLRPGATEVDDALTRLLEVEPERLPYHDRLRGRAARHPIDIGWRGWWDVFVRVFRRVGIDNLGLITAGVTFYIFLALIPAIIAIVTFYGIFTDNVTLAAHVDFLRGYLPDQSIEWISQELSRVAHLRDQGVTLTLAVSVLVSFWSMNNAVVALFGAMNVAYGEREKRTTLGLYLRCFGFTFGALLLGILTIAGIVILPLVVPFFGDGSFDYGGRRVTVPLLFFLVAAGATAIYRVGPSRRPARWRWIRVGAFAAAIGWIGAATLLSWYLSNVANYAVMYGSLGTIIALMFWLYISVYILLAGAWLNSEIEHQTIVDTTVGPPRPVGERGAYVADTIGREAGRHS